MAVGGYGNIAARVSVQGANTTATIFNVVVGTASTEFSQALPASTKEFMLKSRGNAEIQLSYTTGETATKYITISRGAVYNDKQFYTSQTIYFELDKTGVVEIIAFT